ncbi:MAG TPA: hypothetical protein DEG71_06305 [Clostridiales bacterium]|nr:hypothetical protein [Clostridiales bacterium]
MFKTDETGRIMIVSKNPFGTYGHKSNMYKVYGTKRQYVKIKNEKIYLDEIKQIEDYLYYPQKNIYCSQFEIE